MKSAKERKPKKPRINITRTDAKTYLMLLVFGMFTSFSIQRGFGLQEFLGGFLISSILLAVLYKDIRRYKPQYMDNYRMMMLLGLMVVFTLGMGKLSWIALDAFSLGMGLDAGGAASFGLPLPAGAMLIALLFDFHTAIIFAFVTSLLTGLGMNDPTLSIYVFVGSLTASFSVIRCKKRTAILMGGVYLFGAYVLTLLPILLFTGELFTATTPVAILFSAFSALTVVAVVSLALPILEHVFKITTDISLLELLDLEQPLMKGLMITAPGTYHHSIIVGNLVEAVSDLVGVNPLLARVGAYYHDIGKIKMPEYFIENQSWGVSKHEKLTPHMSSMILISHVKEGMELARQHNLPESIRDIITQHHGNALITYFYEKAREQPGSQGDLSEQEYKYPGPKPQTRIAALIMMADAVEASSRVLTDPTPSRIDALVDRIINHIFLAGQLDECELTLKDIYRIKDRFTYILTGILHKRVDYPGFDFNKDSNGNDKQSTKEGKAVNRQHKEGLPPGPQSTGATKG